MGKGWADLRTQIFRELSTALGVLALVFLSFAHQPLALDPADPAFRLGEGGVPAYCGGPPSPEGKGASKSGCAACRIGSGAALAEAPCLAAAGSGYARLGVFLPLRQVLATVFDPVSAPRAPPHV